MTLDPFSGLSVRGQLLAPCALSLAAAFVSVVGFVEPALAQQDAAAAAPAPHKRGGKKRGQKRGSAKARAAQSAPVVAEAAEPEQDDAPEPSSSTTTAAAPSGSLRRSNKMEFDARLIRGETAGTGAVVLFDRGQRELPSLTEERKGFLDATIREVYGETRTVDGRRAHASSVAAADASKPVREIGKTAAKANGSAESAQQPAAQETPAADEAGAPPASKD